MRILTREHGWKSGRRQSVTPLTQVGMATPEGGKMLGTNSFRNVAKPYDKSERPMHLSAPMFSSQNTFTPKGAEHDRE